MSQYVEFFIRAKSDEFLRIGCFTSSSKIYQAFQSYAPWEKIKAVTIGKLEDIICALEEDKHRYEVNIDDYYQEIKFLTQLQVDIDEILERRFDIMRSIKEVQEEIEDVDVTIGYVRSLLWILDSIYYSDVKGYNKDQYIYVGIEVGHPTLEDIT